MVGAQRTALERIGWICGEVLIAVGAYFILYDTFIERASRYTRLDPAYFAHIALGAGCCAIGLLALVGGRVAFRHQVVARVALFVAGAVGFRLFLPVWELWMPFGAALIAVSVFPSKRYRRAARGSRES